MSLSDNIHLIKALPGNHLLILPDAPKFTMIAASDDYFLNSYKTKDDIQGKGVFEGFPENPDNPNQGRIDLIASFERVIKEKKKDKQQPIRYDLEVDGKFVERYWLNVNSPVTDDDGNLVYILHTAEDVTDKIKAAQTEELLKGMRAAHNIFTQTPIPICILKGPELIVELANDHTLELWGKGKEAIGKRLVDALPELTGQGYMELITEVLITGKRREIYESPLRLIKEGKEELIYVNYIYEPYYENDYSRTAGVLAIGNNVTERVIIKRELAEKNESLRDSNEKLNSFLEAVPQIIWTNKPNGEVDFYNHQWFKYTGLSYQQSKEWGWQEVIHPDDLRATMATYFDKLQKGEEIIVENRFKRYDGEYRWQLNRAIPIKDDKGVIKFWIGTSTDIHGRKLAEDALKQSEQQIRSLVESAPFPIGVYIGREMRIQLANQSIIDAWGKGSDVIGKTYAEVLPELKGQHIYQQLDEVLTTGVPFHAKNQRVDLVVTGCYSLFILTTVLRHFLMLPATFMG